MQRQVNHGGPRRGPGRPQTGQMVTRPVRLPANLLDAIGRWRLKRLDIPSLTDSRAIRELLKMALRSEGIEIEDSKP